MKSLKRRQESTKSILDIICNVFGENLQASNDNSFQDATTISTSHSHSSVAAAPYSGIKTSERVIGPAPQS